MKHLNQSSLRRLISVAILALLCVVFTATSDSFLSSRNIMSILRDASIVGIIGVGVTLVIISSGIDLSTGALLAVSAMTMANFYYYTAAPIWMILLAGVLVGTLGGFLNGVLITWLNLPEFIATLATQGIFRGLTYMTAIRINGNIVNQPMRDYRLVSLAGNIGGLYYVTIVFFAVVITGQWLLRRTRFGTKVYAVGSSRKMAKLAGVNADRVRILVYAITGFCCGIGALFMVARMQTATANFGLGLEFNVIAAVVVGGCALSGGSGDMIGTMIGAIFMATLDNGIYKYQVNTSYQPIIKGAIIILVVIFDAWYRGYMTKQVQNSKNQTRPVSDALASGEV